MLSKSAQLRVEYLKTQKCVRCGGTNDLVLVPRTADTIVTPGNPFKYNIVKRSAMLAERKPVCHTKCLLEERVEQGRRVAAGHGTAMMYQYHGCRCLLCVTYARNKNKPKGEGS